jgi:hypothetical protein
LKYGFTTGKFQIDIALKHVHFLRKTFCLPNQTGLKREKNNDSKRIQKYHPPGTPLEIELESEDGSLVYSVEILTGEGTVEVLVDAGTGDILSSSSGDDDDDDDDDSGGDGDDDGDDDSDDDGDDDSDGDPVGSRSVLFAGGGRSRRGADRGCFFESGVARGGIGVVVTCGRERVKLGVLALIWSYV